MTPERPSHGSCKGELHFCCHTKVEGSSSIAASLAANALPILVTSEDFKSGPDPTERSIIACDLLKLARNLPPSMSMYAGDDFSKVDFIPVPLSEWEDHTGQNLQDDHPFNWSNAASGRVALVSACIGNISQGTA